ncbi:glutathione S-transferase T3-like [Primulina eburnea]|uniref:glutathione S-transferase T3-like n=1 Tax=Primulina eburnea TaxID=1245227 RepID=UPI003C6C2F57
MSHPYFMPPVIHGYSTPHTTVMPFISLISNEPATPTFVSETQFSDRESPIEVVNLKKKTDSNVEGSRMRSSWTKVEDEVLARTFVIINDDPIITNDQKADAFWGLVASYYNENRPPGSNTKSANVILSHWHNTIQKKVYRFNANYNSVYSSYRSGHSDEDILRFAYEKYQSENNGVAFNFEHVWKIVKNRPMFTPQSADHFVATKKTRTSELGASNISSNQEVSIGLDEDTRPMRQKSTKRKGKDSKIYHGRSDNKLQ